MGVAGVIDFQAAVDIDRDVSAAAEQPLVPQRRTHPGMRKTLCFGVLRPCPGGGAGVVGVRDGIAVKTYLPLRIQPGGRCPYEVAGLVQELEQKVSVQET